jgi:alkylhydroperoxidase/carboxymuconolactone decarboxylase family protein YurZ
VIDRGLDLSRLDATSDAEIEAFRAHYSAHHGRPLPAYEFWLQMDPSQLKRHRLQARWSADEEGAAQPLHGTLAFLHLYTIWSYEAGIRYEVLHARSLGCTRAGILETLALAFMHSGPRGMHAANDAIRDVLDEWKDAERASCLAAFPANWGWNAQTLQVGLDYGTPELSEREWSRLTNWYLEHCGHVPGYATFLRSARPGVLKGWWARLEGAMRGALPIQMLPFVMIHLNVSRGLGPGIREGVALARSLDMTKSQIHEAIAWGALYGGPAAVSIAAAATTDLL